MTEEKIKTMAERKISLQKMEEESASYIGIVISYAEKGLQDICDGNMLSILGLEAGDFIEHQKGQYNGLIGVVIGYSHKEILIRYLNTSYKGPMLSGNFVKITPEEAFSKIQVK